jgi:DeoR family transcriptional regulator of aga operon
VKTISERHLFIKEQLYKNGFVTVQDLAEQLEVTGATIRRDLRIMEGENLLRRNHGGASLVHEKVIELSLTDRSLICPDEKARIAAAAAAILGENDSMGVTSGSTIEAFVRQLQHKGPIKVVTPSIRLGVLLMEKMDVDLRILGGRIVPNSMSTRDEYSIQGLRNVRCSKLFFSCDGFSIEDGVTSAFVEEAHLTESMMNIAQQRILLADSSKIGKCGFGRICGLEDVDTLITDSGISESLKAKIEALGVDVIIA